MVTRGKDHGERARAELRHQHEGRDQRAEHVADGRHAVDVARRCRPPNATEISSSRTANGVNTLISVSGSSSSMVAARMMPVMPSPTLVSIQPNSGSTHSGMVNR